MRLSWIVGLAALASAVACFENSPPVEGDTESGCTAGTESCPCIDNECVGELMCLSNVCVDTIPGADSTGVGATGPGSSSDGTTRADVSTSGSVTDTRPMTSSGGDRIPSGEYCDPLVDLCEDGVACVGMDELGFFCAEPGPASQYDPCTGDECGPGLLCVEPGAVTACGGMCCSDLCDLFSELPERQCPKPLFCLPVYPPGDAPLGYEHVGVCVN
ncbi:MAG: hypothetical protein K0V04_31705 [Deltaproteobacteria bacterium]|nr:hypothetical protein [Deltaproteobacteria bacterium]